MKCFLLITITANNNYTLTDVLEDFDNSVRMDSSGIEATQAMQFDDDLDDSVNADDNTPLAFLNVPMQKGYPGNVYELFEGENVIGREDTCKVCIPLKALSREHACIEIHGDSHFIYDKGSRNRTRRNKHFLSASVRYELKDGDQLIFGDVEATFQLETNQAVDDGDTTGSECLFETAPTDDDLDITDHKAKLDRGHGANAGGEEELGFESDASSDILEPTQPTNNTQTTMLLSKTAIGNSTLASNITVEETPVQQQRTKRFTRKLAPVDSGSDTDGEETATFRPPPTFNVADSQEDTDDQAKTSLLGAPTQAYVCESDLSTDEEEEAVSKKSLLMAPTQAFAGDEDDVSTCSETSPEKKSLLMAATQAFTGDSEDNQSPAKRKILTEPTQAYTMDAGIEPTVGYDMQAGEDAEDTDESPAKRKILTEPTQAYTMDAGIEPTVGYDMQAGEDAEDTDEPEEKDQSKSLMYEPTQAFLGKADEKDKEDAMSESSEEFVLEGDTDNEDDSKDASNILAAPTLAMETQVVDSEEDNYDTVAMKDEPTQVVEDSRTPAKHSHADNTDGATMAIMEAETQAVIHTSPVKHRKGYTSTNTEDATVAITDAETQVFEEPSPVRRGKRPVTTRDAEATQVLDEPCPKKANKKSVKKSEVKNLHVEDATQVFDENENNNDNTNTVYEIETQVFDEEQTLNNSDKKNKKTCKAKSELAGQDSSDNSTQVFHTEMDSKHDNSSGTSQNVDSTQVFDKSASELPNANGGDNQTQVFESPFADKNTSKQDTDRETKTGKSGNEDLSTQAFSEEEEEGETFDINAMATLAPGDHDETGEVADTDVGQGEATQVLDEEDATCAVEGESTQVFEPTAPVNKFTSPARGKRKAPPNEDATQVLDDATAPVSDDVTPVCTKTAKLDDATQVLDDATVPVSSDTSLAKGRAGHPDDATQVFDDDDDDNDSTAQIHTDTSPLKAEPKTIGPNDATQVFDEQTLQVTAGNSPARGKKRVIHADEATQVFDDATQPVEDTSSSSASKAHPYKPDPANEATQVFHEDAVDHTVAIDHTETATQCFDDENVKTADQAASRNSRGRKSKATKTLPRKDVAATDDATRVFDEAADTVAVIDDIEAETIGHLQSDQDDDNNAATQVFDDTAPVDSLTDTTEEATEKKEIGTKKGRRGRQSEKAAAIHEAVTSTETSEKTKHEISTAQKEKVELPPAMKGRPTRGRKSRAVESTEAATVEQVKSAGDDVTNQEEQIEMSESDKSRKERPRKTDTQNIEVGNNEALEPSKRTRRGKDKKSDPSVEEPSSRPSRGKTTAEANDKTEEHTEISAAKRQSVKSTRGKKATATTSEVKKTDTGESDDSINTKLSVTREDKTEAKTSEKKPVRGRRGRAAIEAESTLEDNKDGKIVSVGKEAQSKGKKKAKIVEEATQRYAEDSDTDGGATQKYVDDNATPDLSEIESQELPALEVISTPAKSPLKSALASPKKERDASPPKKVQFAKRDSESSTESSQSRRSSRQHKVKVIQLPGEDKDKSEPEDKPTTSAANQDTANAEPVPVVKPRGQRGRPSAASVQPSATQSKVADVKKQDSVSATVAETIDGEPENKTEVKEEPAVKGISKRGKGVFKEESKDTDKVNSKSDLKKDSVESSTRGRGRRNKLAEDMASENSEVSEREVKVEKETNKVVKPVKSSVEVKGKSVDAVKSLDDSQAVGKRGRRDKLAIDPRVQTELEQTTSGRSKSRRGKHEPILEVKDQTTIEPDSDGKSNAQKGTAKNNEKEEDGNKTIDELDVKPQTGRRRKRKADNDETKTDTADATSEKDNETTGQRKRGRPSSQVKVESEPITSVKAEVKDEKETGAGKRKRGRQLGKDKVIEEHKPLTDVKKELEEVKTHRPTRGKHKGKESEEISGNSSNADKHSEETVHSQSKTKEDDEVKKETVCPGTSESGVDKETKTSRGKGKGKQRVSKESHEELVESKNAAIEQPEQMSKQRSRGRTKQESAELQSEKLESNRDKTPSVEVAGTPVRNRQGRNLAETPKHANKQVSRLSTPKSSSKHVEEVACSPTLRKTSSDTHSAKVMFTGVVDEQGEKVVKDLGGELVTSMVDCTHLVTDQIRRTVKLLCCLSRGVPIVSPQWLVSSKKSGFFTDPSPFLISDDVSEKKHRFILHRSISKAAERRLLEGFRVHVTKSVKPEPLQMKDIITCAGGEFLAKMPKASSANTVVVSCPDDKTSCDAAVQSDIPVVSAEFILTGILRQEIDINSYRLFAPGNAHKRGAPAAERSEPSKKRRK